MQDPGPLDCRRRAALHCAMAHQRISRRQAVATLAATAAATAATDAAPRDAGLPIIDAHQHLWDLGRVRLPWLPADGPLAGNHVLTDYRRDAAGLGIVGSVYMEVDAPHELHPIEAKYAIDLCKDPRTSLLGAVIGGRPDEPGFAAYLDQFAHEPTVKGLRRVLHSAETPRGACLRDDFVRGIRELGKRRLVFDICIPAESLDHAAMLCELCPETRFVLDHCGNPNVQAADLSAWKRGIDAVSRQPNAACKISGIVTSARSHGWRVDDLAPIVKHCAAAFGPDRILWASDWPVCTLNASLRQWLAAALEIVSDWALSDRRKLFHDNAVRVYRLRPAKKGAPKP